ncbi:MAG: hypothetical protein RLZZ241_2622 [Bacteroidota bacterium]|jgi:hypothetical protein
MEKLYSETAENCQLTQAKKETIAFLLQYSKTLQIIDFEGMQFEANLN